MDKIVAQSQKMLDAIHFTQESPIPEKLSTSSICRLIEEGHND